MSETVTLWRPTGPEELKLVEEAGWRAWPPRVNEQWHGHVRTSAHTFDVLLTNNAART